jgi:hypothetical protein
VNEIAGGMKLIEEAPAAPEVSAAITVTAAGREYAVNATDWKGAVTNPYTFDDMAAKFRRYASSSLGPARSAELIERVHNLEAEADVAQLVRLIRAA